MKKEIQKAEHTGTLKIGDLELPCAVLDDGTRIFSHRGIMSALGRPRKGGRRDRGHANLPEFVSARNLEPFIPDTLSAALSSPIEYIPQHGGRSAFGVNAERLGDICKVWRDALQADALLATQVHIGVRAQILLDGLVGVGINALVDEATGYQDVRSRHALEEILERYISKELLAWTKMFPDTFYREMFRLRGWRYNPFSVARPGYVGTLTNDVIYSRLAPGVLDELRRQTPRDAKGRRKNKFHQRLTEDVEHPRLREHLEATTALMRASNDWKGFTHLLQRAYPKINSNLLLDIDDSP